MLAWLKSLFVSADTGLPGAKDRTGSTDAGLLNSDNLRLLYDAGVELINQGHFSQAKARLNRLILLDPANGNAYFHLGKIAHAEGDFPAAIDLYCEALELKPDLDDATEGLTNALFASGDKEAAEARLIKALASRPQSAHLHFTLGTLYLRSGEEEKAVQCYASSLAINPESYDVHNNLGLILLARGELKAAIASFERALQIKPEQILAHSSLIWALSFAGDGSDDRYMSAVRRFGQHALRQANPYRDWLIDPPVPGGQRLLRVGFVSSELRRHPVMTVFEGVLRSLNRTKLELLAYSMNPLDDEVTSRIKDHFSKWTPIAGMTDQAVARKIREDKVDILIDLSGHCAYNRLSVFAWKPAPVQVSWLGYLASTGVPGMDYVLADPASTPEHVSDWFTEEIWRLPDTFNCFTPPAEHPKLAVTALPAQRNGYITFGSFQRLNKLSDASLRRWGRIMQSLPHAKLWLRNEGLNSTQARERLIERLAQAGVDAERVTFGGNIPEREDYLAVYGQVDIILDTFPYPGVTTTCDALWMGVPTVTLARGGMLGRVGASLLTCAGLGDWVATDEEEYVALALKKASDVEGLARLRATLRQQVAVTPLFDATLFSSQLEDALIAMWRKKMQVVPYVLTAEMQSDSAIPLPPAAGSAVDQETAPSRMGAQALAKGDIERAIHFYQIAVLLKPTDPEAKVALGYVLSEQARFTEAKPHLEAALQMAPQNADAWYLLGKIAWEERDLPAVLGNLSRALDVRPYFDAAFNDLAALYFANRGDKFLTPTILADIRLRSCSSLFYHHLGNFCDEAGEHESAIANYQKALLLSPEEAKTHCNLGHVLMKLGDYETARTHLRRAIGFKPNYFSAHSNLLWMLSFYGENIETEYVAEAKRYGQLVMAAAKPFTQWNRSVQRPDGRIRVGFVSGDLRAHPIGYFLAGVVGKLNHEKLELIAYSMNPRDDEITERIKRGFSEWHVITELNDQAAAHKIHTDGVDILIDITGHAGNNRLPVFAWKPAPVQVGWFAYLASTGVPGIDYVLADAVAAPATVRDQFTEEIWLLPETFNCFMPPDDHPLLVVAPAPALHNGYVTFGSCQRLNKLDDSSLQLWGQVLHALPQSRLRIQNSMLDVPNIRNQFQARLVSAGIPLARCILHGAIADRADHLAAHAQVDIVLDTVRYPGTTTTCEALWMGVPTLTLAGRTLLQRVGASVMTCAGLPDWVAEGEAEYVTLAVKHASNVTRLAKLRAGLREQVAATSLFDAARFAPQLEDALIGIWQRKMACLIG